MAPDAQRMDRGKSRHGKCDECRSWGDVWASSDGQYCDSCWKKYEAKQAASRTNVSTVESAVKPVVAQEALPSETVVAAEKETANAAETHPADAVAASAVAIENSVAEDTTRATTESSASPAKRDTTQAAEKQPSGGAVGQSDTSATATKARENRTAERTERGKRKYGKKCDECRSRGDVWASSDGQYCDSCWKKYEAKQAASRANVSTAESAVKPVVAQEALPSETVVAAEKETANAAETHPADAVAASAVAIENSVAEDTTRATTESSASPAKRDTTQAAEKQPSGGAVGQSDTSATATKARENRTAERTERGKRKYGKKCDECRSWGDVWASSDGQYCDSCWKKYEAKQAASRANVSTAESAVKPVVAQEALPSETVVAAEKETANAAETHPADAVAASAVAIENSVAEDTTKTTTESSASPAEKETTKAAEKQPSDETVGQSDTVTKARETAAAERTERGKRKYGKKCDECRSWGDVWASSDGQYCDSCWKKYEAKQAASRTNVSTVESAVKPVVAQEALPSETVASAETETVKAAETHPADAVAVAVKPVEAQSAQAPSGVISRESRRSVGIPTHFLSLKVPVDHGALDGLRRLHEYVCRDCEADADVHELLHLRVHEFCDLLCSRLRACDGNAAGASDVAESPASVVSRKIFGDVVLSDAKLRGVAAALEGALTSLALIPSRPCYCSAEDQAWYQSVEAVVRCMLLLAAPPRMSFASLREYLYPIERAHITLGVMRLDDKSVPVAVEALKRAFSPSDSSAAPKPACPLPLRLCGLDTFGDRVLFVSCTNPEGQDSMKRLLDLRTRCMDALKRAGIELPEADEPLHPHLTVAKVGNRRRGVIPKEAYSAKKEIDLGVVEFPVLSLCVMDTPHTVLFSSTLEQQ